MKKYYQFADVNLAIDIPDSKMYADSRDLEPFERDELPEPHCFRYEVVEELDPPKGPCVADEPGFRVYDEGDWSVRYIGSVQQSWEGAYMRAAHCGREHLVQVKASRYTDRLGVHTVLGSIAAEHLIAQAGGVVFHSSYIFHDGRAILFTAPSGTGKSTQAELWRSLRGAEIINGDRSAIRVENGVTVAAGLPFSGSSDICKDCTAPLAAVVYLEQAPCTTIRRVTGYEAFRRIWEGCSVNLWNADDMAKVSRVVETAARTVKVFHLACTPDESAVIALEDALKNL